MNNKRGQSPIGRKAVYYSFLIAPLIYIVLMLEMMYFIEWEAVAPFPEVAYLAPLYALVMLVLPKKVQNSIWQKRKTQVHSLEEFHTAYFSVSMVSVAMAESIGVIGLFVYFLTADLTVPVAMCVLSMFAVYSIIPKQAELDERIRELHLESN